MTKPPTDIKAFTFLDRDPQAVASQLLRAGWTRERVGRVCVEVDRWDQAIYDAFCAAEEAGKGGGVMDIIARWRDAITDPPPDGWRGLIRNPDDGDIVWFRDFRGKHYPGDQWLDVTDEPAVAVARVQAAIKRLKDCQEMARGNDEYTVFGTALDVIEEYTEVTP